MVSDQTDVLFCVLWPLPPQVFEGRTEYDITEAAPAVADSSIFKSYVERAIAAHATDDSNAETKAKPASETTTTTTTSDQS